MMQFLATRESADSDSLAAALRELRTRVMLATLWRDLDRRAPLAEVVGAMSDLADVALEAAHRFWTSELENTLGVPTSSGGVRQELLVVGMGKLGGRELNVSSDIDLIFVYPEDGHTVGAREIDNQAFFNRLGQRLIATLDEITAGGRVVRVDMRLRPWGDAGPLALSLAALENYFLVHGRDWERYAWIKARVVAGGNDAQRAELASVATPFVFRKYLDFGAIGSLRGLHAQIRQEVQRRDLADHIKLGRGGIREIEFIAQAHQLIRGGRNRGLQLRATCDVLPLLGASGALEPATVEALITAYDHHRRLEHRLQYLDDAQTHTLPVDPADRLRIARAMGARDIGEFEATLEAHRKFVAAQFDALFAAPAETNGAAPAAFAGVWAGVLEADAARAQLETAGYADAAATYERLRAFRTGVRYARLPAASQERVDAIMPRLIESCARLGDPAQTLARCIQLLEAIGGRATYLALLYEQPLALAKVANLAAASGWAVSYLARYPVLLDELLDPRLLAAEIDAGAFAAELRAAVADHPDDVERRMDAMRERHHAQVFKVLAQDLAGQLSVERLADHLSALADTVLEVSIECAWQQVLTRHCETPRVAAIAYGKLGGKELGYASDLDLVFVYDDPHERAPETYARLAQRLVTWLTSRTGAGQLFDTDLRLRPNGDAGLLVPSLEAFREYQRESAWVWEHQALTRARFAAGDAAIGRAFEAEREAILRMPRAPEKLAAEVVEMRRRMEAAHPNRSGEFDVKHGYGAMIDLEFIVQYLVLAHAAAHPRLTGNLGNIALLGIAAELGLISAQDAEAGRAAYREYRRIQHALRLNEAQFARVEFERVAAHALATRALWKHVFGAERMRG